jgi:hypothetical protein
MTDLCNIAHDQKVQQKKKHRDEELASGAEHAVQSGKKPPLLATDKPDTDGETVEKAGQPAERATGARPSQQKTPVHICNGLYVYLCSKPNTLICRPSSNKQRVSCGIADATA